MRAFATVLFVTLTLAASAPARVVSFGGEAPNALPYEEEPVAEEGVRWLVETMKEGGLKLSREEGKGLMGRKPMDGGFGEGEDG